MDLFYSNFKNTDKYFQLNESESKHVFKSFRKKIGDLIKITNGSGYLFDAEIIEIGRKIKVKIISYQIHEPNDLSIHIALSPLKNISRFEWFIEKATELGITEITPIISNYTEKKRVNVERLEKIIISSLKQSNQFHKPKLNNIETFSGFLKKNKDEKIIANLKTTNKLKKELITSNKICLIIGPEGGFSENEIIEAIKYNSKEISLGKSRLRSETAAIYGISAIKALSN